MPKKQPQDPQPNNTAAETFRDSIVQSFSGVEEPRKRIKRIKHTLCNIFFITLSAVLCGANNVKEVATFAKSRKSWLLSILDLSSGVPCYNTFWWVFMLLDPESFEKGFSNWMQSITTLTNGKVLAIDGKALRGTAIKGKPNSFIHMVSMWECDAGVSLGQIKVDEKSNEITAIPKLLDLIDIEGAVITIDAMGTQTAIAEKISENGGDYVLALKGNHSNLFDEVENFFMQAEEVDFDGIEHTSYHTVEKGHGRYEKRHIYATEDIDWLPQREEWKDLNSIVLIIRERTANGKTSTERHMYLSSLSADARQLAYAIRSHWGIENRLHWILDVTFQEDAQQARSGHIAENMSVMRRIALAILKQDCKTDGGIELRRKKASWNNDYLLSLIGIKSF